MRNLARGLSLMETVIAMFLFTAGAALVAGLFHTALRYSARVEDKVLAALVAEKSLQEVRAWAAESNDGTLNYAGSWSDYDGVERPDPDYPRFQVLFDVEDRELSSPSSEFVALLPVEERPTIQVKVVRVRVRWRTNELSVSTQMEEPPRQFRSETPLVISGAIPGNIQFGEQIDFSVEAFDSSDQPIKDLQYEWSVEALSTFGTTYYQGNGQKAVFKPQKEFFDGTVTASPKGECRVKVRAVYRGEERWGTSDIITVDY